MSSPDADAAATQSGLRTVFMGTGEIGLPAFEHLLTRHDCLTVGVVTQPDKPAGRHRELKSSVIKSAALQAGIPVFQPVSLKQPDALTVIKSWEPDLVVVMAFGQILPQSVLDLPRLACLNLHASILPKFRGASPIHAVIAAGESRTGVTAMHMASGLDTGDVVLIEPEAIKRRDTAGSLHDRLAHTATKALDRALQALITGTATRVPQDHELATYAGKLSRVDALIDWTAGAEEIERRIRAMNPWPAAWTTLPLQDGTQREVKIFSAILKRKRSGKAGEILEVGNDGILIAAERGAILLREIQMEGRKRMLAGVWQRGTPVILGGIAGKIG